ncbi:MAG: choice-of-anchor D domain-containing protein [Candidatus Kapabacteria bacterium]|nr:choice-of-anchor D domain-containing protein [Candidatus Kapabacteria bacterium]
MKNLFYKSFAVIFLLSFYLPYISNSAGVDMNNLKALMPMNFGATNAGRDFWFTVPPCFYDASFSNENLIRVFVTSAEATSCILEVPGKGYYSYQQTMPNDVIQFALTPNDAQPYVKINSEPCYPEKVYPGAGVHVYSDGPIIVYVAVRFHYTSDSWVCIPTAALGKDYLVSSYGDMTSMFPSYTLPSLSGCVAAFDDTKVRFTLGGNPKSVTAGGLQPLQSENVVLNKGDVWMISTKGADADLSGSKFSANKPVAVVSGNQCANIPTDNQWCDYVAEMDVPTYVWGLDYYIPIIPMRKYPSIIRIYGRDPGTSVYRDGNMIATFTQVPGLLGKGWFEQRMHPMGIKPHSVALTGTAPINVVQYNCGTQEDGYPIPNSDPFEMRISPLQQFQTEVTFCTPGLRGNFGFPDNYLNLVYETNEFGYMPDDMMFAKVEGGGFAWQKLNQKYAGIDEKFSKLLQPGNRQFANKLIRLSGDGVYKIKSVLPFAVYNFGFSANDSYGHPVSLNLVDMDHPETNPPDPKWTTHCNGDVNDGTVTDMPDDDSMRSNLARIDLIKDSTFNYQFSYKDFIPGQTRTTTWKLNVIDPLKDAQAFVKFSDRRGNDTVIVVQYTSVKIQVDPKTYDFGLSQKGDVKTMDFTVSNLSPLSPLTISKIFLQKGNHSFTIDTQGIKFPIFLPPSGKLTFKVRFDALSEGHFADSIIVTDDSCYRLNLSQLTADVGGPVIIVGANGKDLWDADFSDQEIYTSGSKLVSIKNTGNKDLIINDFKNFNNPDFKVDFGRPISSINPLIIKPGDPDFLFRVTFTPNHINIYMDSLIFYSNAFRDDNVCKVKGNSFGIDKVENIPDLSYRISIYPNPVNSNTANFNYSLSYSSDIEIKIYNSYQETIAIPFNGEQQSGDYSIPLSVDSFPNGVYFIRINSGGEIRTVKLIIMK